jgi:hypothetical protein
MKLTRKKMRWILISLTLSGAALVGVIHFTDFCVLRAVTLDGKDMAAWQEVPGLSEQKPVANQPLSNLAAHLLKRNDIVRVDIHYDLPHALAVETNKFKPFGFLLDTRGGNLYGLSRKGWLIPVPHDQNDWEHLFFVGLAAPKLYETCSDPRVVTVLSQLERIHEDDLDLYRLISEIDFGEKDCLTVRLSGLPFTILVNAGRFQDHLPALMEFLEKFQPDIHAARKFDLRYDNLIIQTGGRKRNG